MGESTEEYQPATIGDALRDAFEEAEGVTDTPDTPAEPEEPVEAEAAAEDTGEEVDEPAEAPPEEVKDEGLTPPEHWPESDKEVFMQATPELQEWALKRDKERDRMITEKTTAIAEKSKHYEALDKVLEPYLPHMQRAGVSEAQVIANLLGVQALLENPNVGVAQKRDSLQRILQPYGIELAESDGYEEEDSVAPLKAEVDQLKQQQINQANMAQVNRQIEAFKAESKDGQPAHPYFDEVEREMATLVAGGVHDLGEAYEKAVWANPTVRQKLLDAERAKTSEAEQKKLAEQKRKKAAAAKKATSKVVKGKPNAEQVEEKPATLRDSLAEEWAKQVTG